MKAKEHKETQTNEGKGTQRKHKQMKAKEQKGNTNK